MGHFRDKSIQAITFTGTDNYTQNKTEKIVLLKYKVKDKVVAIIMFNIEHKRKPQNQQTVAI